MKSNISQNFSQKPRNQTLKKEVHIQDPVAEVVFKVLNNPFKWTNLCSTGVHCMIIESHMWCTHHLIAWL